MRKKIFPIILLFLAVVFIALYQPAVFKVSCLFMDEKENVYFVLTSKDEIEIRRISANGMAFGKCKLKRFYGNYCISLNDMVIVDEKAYCVFLETSVTDFSPTRIIWAELNFLSGKTSVIYEESCSGDNMISGVRLSYIDNALKSVAYYLNGADIKGFDINTKAVKYSYSFRSDSLGDLNGVAFLYDRSMIFTNTFGNVFIRKIDGEIDSIYESSCNFSQFKADAEGGIYFYFDSEKAWKKGNVEADSLTLTEADIIFENMREGFIQNQRHYSTLTNDGAEIFDDGTVRFVPSPSYTKLIDAVFIVSIWASITVVYALVLYIVKKYRLTVSLLFKQALIITLIMSLGVYALLRIIDRIMIDEYKNSLISSMQETILKTINNLDIEQFQKIDWSEPEKDMYFLKLREEFRFRVSKSSIMISRSDAEEERILYDDYYIELMYISNGKIYTAVYDYEYVGTPLEMIGEKDNIQKYQNLINENAYTGYVYGFERDDEWAVMLIPFYLANGEPAGLIECGISMRQFEMYSQKNTRTVFVFTAMLTVVLLIIITLGLWLSTRHMKKLRYAVESIGQGNYNLMLESRGNDEIAKISGALNDMSIRICENTKELEKINTAYHRFLPSEILQKLHKESILNVGRGDNTIIDAVILYVSVGGFDKITGAKNADDAFEVFNAVCADIMKTTSDYGGLTESCNQSGFICLFDDENTAYNASLAIRKRLETHKKLPITVMLVLLKGKVLIGIAGDDKRLCTLTVSKSINLAKALADEGMLYGAGTVCGEGFENIHFRRYLGEKDFESDKVVLYDCYEGDETEIMQSKLRLQDLFIKGVKLFEKSMYQESKAVFIEYLKQSVPDMAARRYLFMCESNLLKG